MRKILLFASILWLSACATENKAPATKASAPSAPAVAAAEVKPAKPALTADKTVAAPKKKPAMPAGYMCLKDQYGDEVCGYDCKRTKDDLVCAQKPDEKCFIDGPDVVCGKNCRKNQDGDVDCK